jgi:hypothetical protein
MALLSAKALDLGNGNSVDTNFSEGVTDVIELEWFDNCGN